MLGELRSSTSLTSLTNRPWSASLRSLASTLKRHRAPSLHSGSQSLPFLRSWDKGGGREQVEESRWVRWGR